MAQNTRHIAIILYLCVTMTQSTLTHCYHLIPVCHNNTKYTDTLLSSYTCVSQRHKVHRHIVIILCMCVTMTQSTLIHCYHLIPVCHNDTKCTDTLLSSHTCVLQWHKVHWHIAIILYLCVTMTQSTLTHCYHLIHVCHNDTKYTDTLLSSYTCVSQWHKVHRHIIFIIYLCCTMTQSTSTHCFHLIHACHNDTKYIDTLLSPYTCVSQWHKVHRHIAILYLCVTMTQSTSPSLISSYTCVYQWHIVIILYLCVTMTQSTVTYSYHLIPVCTNGTLLSSYTCLSQ
jgi:hypothetical protein